MYLGHSEKGFLYLASTITLAVVAYIYHADYLNSYEEYLDNMEAYKDATDQAQISTLRDAAGESYNSMIESAGVRNSMAGIMGAVWAVNFLHITIDLTFRSKK